MTKRTRRGGGAAAGGGVLSPFRGLAGVRLVLLFDDAGRVLDVEGEVDRDLLPEIATLAAGARASARELGVALCDPDPAPQVQLLEAEGSIHLLNLGADPRAPFLLLWADGPLAVEELGEATLALAKALSATAAQEEPEPMDRADFERSLLESIDRLFHGRG